jgi:cytochrome c peroxidase
MKRHALLSSLVVSLATGVLALPNGAAGAGLSPQEALGKKLFFDQNLSSPPGQSCASCHAQPVGYTGPNPLVNQATAVYPGAIHTRFGNRKPPSAAYGGASPVLHFDRAESVWIGGMFWDGRATGQRLADPLAEQSQGPFLSPVEQNVADAKALCTLVKGADYAALFQQVWGSDALDCEQGATGAFERIARSLSAYEKSAEVNPFSSKYDFFLQGKAQLTPEEGRGLALFVGKGKCAGCHTSSPGPQGELPLFTDFTYDNLGVPRNPANPFYGMPREINPEGADWVDLGLGGYLKTAGHPREVYEPELGKVKVPTLRNVDQRPHPGFTKAYMHNGYFKTLEEVVHFYNTRDVGSWPKPEYEQNLNKDEMGNLGLTTEEEAAIVAFMKTLNDGYTP